MTIVSKSHAWRRIPSGRNGFRDLGSSMSLVSRGQTGSPSSISRKKRCKDHVEMERAHASCNRSAPRDQLGPGISLVLRPAGYHRHIRDVFDCRSGALRPTNAYTATCKHRVRSTVDTFAIARKEIHAIETNFSTAFLGLLNHRERTDDPSRSWSAGHVQSSNETKSRRYQKWHPVKTH